MRNILLFLMIILTSSAWGQYCMDDRFGIYDTLFDPDQIIFDTDIVYGEAENWLGESELLKLDVYRPRPSADTLAKRPMVFYIHGGGFHAGSKSNPKGKGWAEAFSRRGYVFVSIDYRVGWPVEDTCYADQDDYIRAVYRAAQDTRAAYRYMIEHADDYAIDTAWTFLMGASAGGGLSFFTPYYTEEDFAPWLSEELGPLEYFSNDLTHPINPKAVVTRAAAVDNLDLLDRRDIPHLLFHGNCDLTVPYNYGPLFWCFSPSPFFPVHGSGDIADRFEELDRCYINYKSLGNGHVGIADDSVVLFSAPFFKDIMCGDCETIRYERPSGKNICRENSTARTWSASLLWPNPTDTEVEIVLDGPFDEVIPLRLIDYAGRPAIETFVDFVGPTMLIKLDVSELPAGVYVVQAGNRIKQARLLVVR